VLATKRPELFIPADNNNQPPIKSFAFPNYGTINTDLQNIHYGGRPTLQDGLRAIQNNKTLIAFFMGALVVTSFTGWHTFKSVGDVTIGWYAVKTLDVFISFATAVASFDSIEPKWAAFTIFVMDMILWFIVTHLLYRESVYAIISS
jgi:hypothetical protein